MSEFGTVLDQMQAQPKVRNSINSMYHRIQSELENRRENGLFRSLETTDGVDFCSNDYLGLACHDLGVPELENGSTGSRLISGNSKHLEKLEKQIASFHGFEQSLLFSSGYAANLGLLACLGKREDVLISDELIHASLIDGARLSYARRVRFQHNSVADLRAKLEQESLRTEGQIFVVVESLYSMDGDFAPLTDISLLCEQFDALFIVDEAHAVGVYGRQGRGLIAQHALQNKIFAAIYTFGKALGFHGAAVAGSANLHQYMINFCRPFIYTTAPSPHTVAMTKAAYDKFIAADKEREKLNDILLYFENSVKAIELTNAYWMNSETPIQGLIIPGNNPVKEAASILQANGFAVKAIVSPTVPEGQERLRISLHSFNTRDELDGLATILSDVLN